MRRYITIPAMALLILILQTTSAYGANDTWDVEVSGSVSTNTSTNTLSPGNTISLDLKYTNKSSHSIGIHVYDYVYVHKSLTLTSVTSNDFPNANFTGPHYDETEFQTLHPKLRDLRIYLIYHESMPVLTSPQATRTFHITFSVNEKVSSGTRLFTAVRISTLVSADETHNSSYVETEFANANGQEDENKISKVYGINSGDDPDFTGSNNVWNYSYAPASLNFSSSNGATANSSAANSSSVEPNNQTRSGTSSGTGASTQISDVENKELVDKVEVAYGQDSKVPKRINTKDKNNNVLAWTNGIEGILIGLSIALLCCVLAALPIRKRYMATIHSHREYRRALKINDQL